MKTLLQKFVGQEIGINYKEANKFHVGSLVSVNDNYFTVEVPNPQNTMFHYPYRQLIFVSECTDKFPIATGMLSVKKVNAVIQVYTPPTGSNDAGIGVGIIF